MRKVVILFALLAFIVAVPMAMAAEKPAAPPPAGDKVNCCTAGKCAQMPKADCEKGGGKVVMDCKDCK